MTNLGELYISKEAVDLVLGGFFKEELLGELSWGLQEIKKYPFDTYIRPFDGIEVEANTGIPADQYKPFSTKGTF